MLCSDCKSQINDCDLFTCKDCNMIAHRECNMYSIEQIEQYRITSCDLCRCQSNPTTSSCCLCSKSSGLLKRIEYNHNPNWVHRHCLPDRTAYSLSKGIYIYHLCKDDACSKCIKPQGNKREEETGGDYALVSTKIKCEVCLKVINEINQQPNSNNNHYGNYNYSRCNCCLSWYHDKCEKEYCKINYINCRGKCIKCNKEPKFSKCCLCLSQGGLMVPCNDNESYAHSLCILSFNTLFKKKRGNRIAYELISERQSMREMKSQCCICNKVSQYTIECNTCKIRFHPYCAFKADFTVMKVDMTVIEFKCTVEHHRYPKELNNFDKDNESNMSSETTACSLAHNITTTPTNLFSNSNSRRSIVIKDITEIKKTFTVPEQIIHQKRKCKYNIKAKEKLNTNKDGIIIEDSRQMTKFNWRQLNKYYRDFTEDDIGKAFPYSFYTNDQIYDLIKETSQQKNKEKEGINSNDYVLCNIRKNRTSYYILFKMLLSHHTQQQQLQEKDEATLLSTISEKDWLTQYNSPLRKQYDNTNNSVPSTFLSKKTNPQPFLHSYYNNRQSNSIKPQFIRAFRLNSFSNKMLSNEKQIETMSIDEDLSYIDKQIIQKKEILKGVIVSNIHLAKSISLGDNLNISATDPMTEITSELTTIKSINNCKTLIKRLKEGISDKAYSNLFYGDNPNQSKSSTIVEDTYEYYKSESECCVCLAYCSYSSTHVIYCDNCNVSVHLNCYGIQTLPQSKFKCDLCANNPHFRIKEIRCCFCLNTHGAMKKINKSDWAHITCVLISQYAQFENYHLLNKIIWSEDYDRFILSDNKDNHCSICNQSGGETFKCINCSEKYHFFCAYFQGYKLCMINNTSKCSNKSVSLTITQCPNDEQWNPSERQLQITLRKLVYIKKDK